MNDKDLQVYKMPIASINLRNKSLIFSENQYRFSIIVKNGIAFNEHTITITCIRKRDVKSTEFKFNTTPISTNSTSLTEDELFDAMLWFLNPVVMFMNHPKIGDIMDEYPDLKISDAKIIYNQAKSAYHQLKQLGLSDGDIYDLHDILNNR